MTGQVEICVCLEMIEHHCQGGERFHDGHSGQHERHQPFTQTRHTKRTSTVPPTCSFSAGCCQRWNSGTISCCMAAVCCCACCRPTVSIAVVTASNTIRRLRRPHEPNTADSASTMCCRSKQTYTCAQA